MYSEKFLKNSVKLLSSPFPVILETIFSLRALKSYSKGTLRSLQGHFNDIWALEGHLGTRALRH